MEFKHYSVMLDECIEGLNIKTDGIYVDATVGGGGHSYEIAKRLNDFGKLICFDQDEEALYAAKEKLKEYKEKIIFIHSNFENIKTELNNIGIYSVDGILADLGVSSYQLDNKERGFSYMSDAPLDMRMDKSSDYTAFNIVNEYSERELFNIIKLYGEEKFAKKIASNIVKNRPIETTLELVKVISDSIPKKYLYNNSHPAKRTFQAIRIELNKELEVLKNGIDQMVELLNDNGRLCIITFHSLEDRIVKHFFKECQDPCICPSDFPKCVCGRVSKGEILTRKPILPTDKELEENSRSASAKLRIFMRRSYEL